MNMKFVTLAAASALLIAGTTAGMAASATKSPGQMMHQKGSMKGHPGASGYAPGHQMKQQVNRQSSTRGPGASSFAPGHRKPPTTTGSGNFR
jgi:Spy/CpxP family protein refolding chaperone